MAKLPRVFQKIFGSTAGPDEMISFGSLAAGATNYTADPATIQSLANFLGGWFSAVVDDDVPAIEDMNALCFLIFYQLAYLFQAGIPEWDTDTVYYTGSKATSSGVTYVSLTDANTGNAVTDTTKWKVDGGRFRTVVANTAIALTDDIIRSDTSAATGSNANALHTLPAASTWAGQRKTVKDVGDGTFYTEVKGNGAETIDGTNTWAYKLQRNESATFYSNGTTVDVL